MSPKRMRIAALCLLMTLLIGCSAQSGGQAKLLLQEVQTSSGNLKVAYAQRGDLQREYTTGGSVAFPKQTRVRLEAEEAQFVEYQVSIGQMVEQGDVIAVFRRRSDNIRLEAIRLELKELETARSDGLDDRAEQMEALKESMEPFAPDMNGYNDAKSDLELQILNMQMKKLQLEQEQFMLRMQEQERLLKEERQKLLEAEEDLVVTAPVSGVVATVQYMTPGQLCTRGQSLVVIHDPTQLMLVADAVGMGELRIGQAVEVRVGNYNSRITIPGHVVAADNLLPPELKTGKACIVPDVALGADVMSGVQVMTAMQVAASAQVSAMDVDVQDALIVPQDAVQFENGKAWVEMVKGSGTALRYVQAGPNDRENIMILAGLEEGDAVIVK